MKYIFIFVIIFAVFVPLWSAPVTNSKTTIVGYLPTTDRNTGEVLLRVWNGLNAIERTTSFKTTLKDGRFSFEVHLSRPHEVSLLFRDNDLIRGLILMPGDSIIMHIPNQRDNRLDDITFSGIGFKKYQVQAMLLPPKYNGPPVSRTLQYYIESRAESRKHRLKVMEQFRDVMNTEEFTAIRIRTLSTMYRELMICFQAEPLTDSLVRNLYFNEYLKRFPLTEDLMRTGNLLQHSTWQLAIEDAAVVDYCVRNNRNYSKAIFYNKVDMYNLLAKTYAQSPQLSAILGSFIMRKAQHRGVDNDLNEISMDFLSRFPPDDPYVIEVKQMDKAFTRLMSGQPAFEFSLPDTAGNILSSKDLLGKVVIMEFLLNGCTGCKQMVPKLEAMAEAFKDSDIAFVSVSADRTLKQFKSSIGKFSPLRSRHVFTGGDGVEHPIIHFYSVTVFPTLLIIGKDGLIVAARAPDPRYPEQVEKLYALVRQAL
ncbi:MAG: TlpA family protein disulfide reductase [Cyclobacteriaceae bacterium]|nr:TlpA family protein disulfide reductase [Cyclobacteriaceae bacterium]